MDSSNAKAATGIHVPTFGWMIVALVVALVLYHVLIK